MPPVKQTLTALTLAASTVLFSAALPRHASAEEPKKTTEVKVQKSELNSEMEDMDEAMKKLRRSIRKADQNTASLKMVQELQTKAVGCKICPGRSLRMYWAAIWRNSGRMRSISWLPASPLP